VLESIPAWDLYGAFVEHLDYYDEVPQFFSECLRVLRPHGVIRVIRVIVSDSEKYLKAYCSDGWEQMSFSPLLCAYEATGSFVTEQNGSRQCSLSTRRPASFLL